MRDDFDGFVGWASCFVEQASLPVFCISPDRQDAYPTRIHPFIHQCQILVGCVRLKA
ncbi:MAG: hypothetical protein QNJ47_23860 [Nostocaceae cyanobacterium]|nr:hypothetical protein [Nostocaceae cyanobacterium]